MHGPDGKGLCVGKTQCFLWVSRGRAANLSVP
jgi:hypothetical protein